MTTTAEPTTLEIGKARVRKEDARLITGRTRYTDAITPPGTLHIARGPLHARARDDHRRSTSPRPRQRPGRHRRLHRRRPGRRGRRPALRVADHAGHEGPAAPAAGRRPRCTSPVRASPSWSPARAAEARDAADLVESTTTPLEPVLDMEAALADGATLVHPDLGTNENATWVFDSGAAGTGGSVDEAHHRRRVRPRLDRGQAPVPPAAPDPGVHGAALLRRRPDRRAADDLRRHPGPAHPAHDDHGDPRACRSRKLRVIAPDVGGGFGGKIGVLPEEMLCVAARAEARQAGQVDRDPLGVAARRPPRPRPDPGHHDHGQAATARSPAWTSTCSPTWAPTSAWSARACRSSARSCSTRSTRSRRYKFTCTNVFTTKTLTDAYRGAGRPEATFAIERIMDELAVELGRDPMELREQNWIKHEEFPFTTVVGLTYDTGNYEQATDAGHGDRSTTRACAASRRSAARNDDPVQLGIGISTFTEMCGLAPSRVLGSLAYGAGGWEAASVRMLATGKVEVITGASGARPGPRDGVQPDRRRPARRAVRGRRDPARRHPDLAEGPGHLRVALAGRRRHRDRQGGREGHRQGQEDRRAPAGGVRGRPRVRQRHVHGQGHRQGQGHPGDRVRHVHGARLPGGHGAHAGLRRRVRPGELLLPARHAPGGDRGRHRDRPRRPAQVRLRRRRRHRDQPADRRGPGARRARPGHRAGPVRGGQLRRAGHPGQRHVRRLHAARRRPTCPASTPPRSAPRPRRTRWASRVSARPAPSPPPRPS